MATITPGATTSAALAEKKKLRKGFKLFDMIFYTVATLLGIDTLGTVSSHGGQVLAWLLISALTFLLPYGLLVSELGTTFPQEGGVYEWCKMAGGSFYAALGSMLYWISNPLWLGGTLSVTAIAAIKSLGFANTKMLFGGTKLNDALSEMGIALLFIWGTTWCSILSLRVGKWLCVLGSYIKLALLTIFALLALCYFFRGYATGEHLGMSDMLPTGDWGMIVSVILPVLIFNWVGFEVQNGAAEEMNDPHRDVPRSLLHAGTIALVAYIIPITVILFTLSKNQLSNASGFMQSFKVVARVVPSPFGPWLCSLIAAGVIVALASSGGSWIIGANRTYAIAALDRAAPLLLGRFSTRFGTPVAVSILTGITATLAMAAAISINTFGSDTITALFTLVLGFTISTTTLSYLFIFPSYLILRYKYPHVPRPYRVPGGLPGAWLVTLLTFGYAALTSYFILIPTDSTVKSSDVSRFTYEATQFAALAVIVLLTIIFYLWGHTEKREQDLPSPESQE
ncbi:MAG TPA: APC family permease [Ktedonosporobacter sp.]|nr:APC family permease [Ktedonosporobacter sp.]